MPKPRKQLVSLDATPFYHCYSRCVRRAMLCGSDPITGKSYEYRRQQIQDYALRLASLFCIDIAAISVMSNHYHLVVHVCREDALTLSAREVIYRWHSVYSGNPLARKFINGESLEQHELHALNDYVEDRRQRLFNISWFMRALNEGVARRANAEDNCTGHFWESRFKSNALLDEQALLSCMAYCDLNPIRDGVAETPENSDYTSVQMRIRCWKDKARATDGWTDDTANSSDTTCVVNNDSDHTTNPQEGENFQPKSLLPFVGDYRNNCPAGIHFNLIDYLQLVDWTGRQIRDDKRGYISETAPPILSRLHISPEHWIYLCTHFESRFKGIVGSLQSLRVLSAEFGYKRNPNRSNSEWLFS